jgi:hypothetical protein
MELWDRFVESVRESLEERTQSHWVSGIRAISSSPKDLTIIAPDSFHAVWFQEHLLDQAKQFFKNATGRSFK